MPDPTAALNEVLSDVIDVVSDVKQGYRKVPEAHALHEQLDALLNDLRRWATELTERDAALGVSPLSFMPSVAGREPSRLWRDAASDDDVRRIVGEHLDRLGHEISTAVAEQTDDASRAALADVARGVDEHREALR